jgi:hypothetical protein
MIAGGGGGGGSLDGVPGVGISGILPGTKINRINGGQGGDAAGGVPGESGGVMNSSWAATAGTYYVGGNGSEFGAGGGGGFFGGGKSSHGYSMSISLFALKVEVARCQGSQAEVVAGRPMSTCSACAMWCPSAAVPTSRGVSLTASLKQ